MLYEVNIDLDAGIREAYFEWLGAHVAEICALPGFVGAEVFDVLDPPPAPGRVAICMQYRLTGPDALETYLREHAPRLRADGIARFGEAFRASRRVLRVRD